MTGVDIAGIAFGAGNGHLRAVAERLGAVPGADDGGDAEFAGDDGGVAGAPATVGDDGGGDLHDRLPVRIGHVGDQYVAGLDHRHFVGAGHQPHRAVGHARAHGFAFAQHVAAPLQLEGFLHGAVGLHGLGAGLDDEQIARDAVQGPFDVHGARLAGLGGIVFFDENGVSGERQHLFVVDAVAVAERLFHIDVFDRFGAVVGVHHPDSFAAQMAFDDGPVAGRQGGLEDIELVRVHGPLDHVLAQAVGGGDEDYVAETGFRVQGEHHPRRAPVRTDHLLHRQRQGHLHVFEALMGPVGDGAVGEQGSEDLQRGLLQGLHAADVEQGLLLAGERGVG